MRALRRWRRRAVADAAADELFPTPWPAEGPAERDFAAALVGGAAAPPRVAAAAIHLVGLAPGVSGVQAARQLLSDGYRARSDMPALPLRTPLDWGADPHGDDNWRVQLNMLRLLDPLIHAHEETGDPATLRDALGLALDWHRFHDRPGHANPWAWQDMMTGLRSLRLAYLAEKIRTGAFAAAADERRALAAMLAAHWRRLTAPGFFRYTNHTVWDLHGLTALLRIVWPDGDARARAWHDAAGARLDHLLGQQFDARGVHRENSPQYHFVACAMFRVLHRSGWYTGGANRLRSVLAQAGALDGWMRFPDGRVLPIGDSDGHAPGAQRLPVATGEAPGDAAQTLDLGSYLLVRRLAGHGKEDWSMLAVKAGYDQPWHRHDDALSVLWSESGCDIVVDPGKYAYDRGRMRDYFRSPRAHNLVAFERRGRPTQAARAGDLTVRRIERTAWGVELVAAVWHAREAIHHERRILFAPGRWLVTVDRFVAAQAVGFAHYTHLAPEFAAALDGGRFVVHHADGSVLRVAQQASVPVRARVERGARGIRPQGWASRGYRRAEPCPTLSLSGRAPAAALVVALSLDPRGRLVAPAAGGLEWHCGRRVPLPTGPLETGPGGG